MIFFLPLSKIRVDEIWIRALKSAHSVEFVDWVDVAPFDEELVDFLLQKVVLSN